MRPASDGFTLIEALVALAVLGLTAVAILGAAQGHLSRIEGLESRALGEIIAQNHLVSLELGLTTDTIEAEALGRNFRVATDRSPTIDPDLVRVDITVIDQERNARAARLTGFLSTGALR